MRCPIAVSALLLSGLVLSGPVLAQDTGDTRVTPTGRTVTATGQTKPPAPGLTQSDISSVSQEQMLKAQRAAQARDKAWDAKMNKTMGSICKGC
ncbi:hypothetical protein ASF53_23745 [Methylobacterium sp. Leaf123]|uniref:hypothetical protein n=1 Tax=Methylobacterium sp. Leaf123 TaxID=1736264 RepID=UPI0006F24D68|nr:hypothetical protein [Methylobacterium sp. Leaf123]KQQ20141.1 hypothetical protein ASF53_23745 [Methylobacterium sp. Leaf123]